MLLDDFLQHLDRLAPLVGQHKTGCQFLPGVRFVRLEFEHSKIERDGFLHLLRSGEIITAASRDRCVTWGERERFVEDAIDLFQFVRLGVLVRLGNEREVKFAQLGPERGVVGFDLRRAVERLQRAFAIAGRQLHLGEALITFNLVRRERHCLLRITNRRLHLLEILGVDVSQLEIRAGFLRLGLDRILQDVDRAGNRPAA